MLKCAASRLLSSLNRASAQSTILTPLAVLSALKHQTGPTHTHETGLKATFHDLIAHIPRTHRRGFGIRPARMQGLAVISSAYNYDAYGKYGLSVLSFFEDIRDKPVLSPGKSSKV